MQLRFEMKQTKIHSTGVNINQTYSTPDKKIAKPFYIKTIVYYQFTHIYFSLRLVCTETLMAIR